MTDGVDTLEIKDLWLARGGKPVVHGISMTFRRGEISTIIGANGAGKSSTVLAMAGAIPVAGGRILHNGTEITGLAADHVRRRGVALVPEGHPVLGDLTVLDNLRAAASTLTARELSFAVDRALTLFPELTSRLNVPASALSGGQKQMVLLGQAIIASPDFLLIDELSLGLAPTIVNRLADTVQKLTEDGTGIILIEQFTTLALRLATRAYVLERGRLAYEGTSEELLQKPEILHSAYLSA